MIVMFGCQHKSWQIICEKFQGIHTQLRELNNEKAITLSVGVCVTDQSYSNKIYQLVDDALYHSKHKGRAGCTLMDENHQILDYWRINSN